jgi:dienelactone hydrolase
MKEVLVVIYVLLLANVQGQKPLLDTSVFKKWPFALNCELSNDENYIAYTTHQTCDVANKLFLKDIAMHKILEVNNVQSFQFSKDSRTFLFQKFDTIGILSLSTNRIKYITNIQSYKLVDNEKQQMIILQKFNFDTLIFLDLPTRSQKVFNHVKAYWLSPDMKKILLHTEIGKSTNRICKVVIVDFESGNQSVLWAGEQFNNLILDNHQIAFIVNDPSNQVHTIYHRYFNSSMKTKLLLNDSLLKINQKLYFGTLNGFSANGKRIFMKVKEYESVVMQPSTINIWSYRSKFFAPAFLNLDFSACLNIEDHHLIRLQQRNEEIQLFMGTLSDTIAIVRSRAGHMLEFNWNPESKSTFYFISTQTGNKRLTNMITWSPSPSGRYIFGSIADSNRYCFYNVYHSKQSIINLPGAGRIKSTNEELKVDLFVLGWLSHDSFVLISDHYDIWKVDPAGKKLPENITNGFGYNNSIELQIFGHQMWDYVLLNPSDRIILRAFNYETKETGFYYINGLKRSDPVKIFMGSNLFHNLPYNFTENKKIYTKTKYGRLVVVKLSSVHESSNFYITKDFRNFKMVSDVHPERSYNWLTSELLNYSTLNNISSKAILYKPENFDSTKRYPIIFTYYEKNSDDLNQYISPEPNNGGINISWFVSNGYLVCVPDIEFVVGHPGASAFNSVMGVLNLLKKNNWIDTVKMGLCGHSFGGFETNYIITHTNVFAAAYSGSGTSNLISSYGALRKGGTANSVAYEIGQYRMRNDMWNIQEYYLKNSPVINANKVTTPLLLMNNKLDSSVLVAQGIELYTSLKKLNKQVWLLQYKGEGHTIDTYSNALDFTIRTTQFFDHFLKDSSAPVWLRY